MRMDYLARIRIDRVSADHRRLQMLPNRRSPTVIIGHHSERGLSQKSRRVSIVLHSAPA